MMPLSQHTGKLLRCMQGTVPYASRFRTEISDKEDYSNHIQPFWSIMGWPLPSELPIEVDWLFYVATPLQLAKIGLTCSCVIMQCKDAPWPANEGGKCKAGLTCHRVSQYHWGCDTKQPPTGDSRMQERAFESRVRT